MIEKELKTIIENHEAGKPFTPLEVKLSSDACAPWVRFKVEPKRFTAAIFDGEWALTQQHPQEGNLRLIRVITGKDGISRIIGRQGKHLFACPWFQ